MNAPVTSAEPVTIARILKMLPHRYPFLMVDRVIEMRGEEFGIGIKNVTINEPQFQGHFPDNPIFPGVLLLEGMAQTAGVLCVLAWTEDKAPPPYVYFMTMEGVKFRRPVIPGDTVEFHMTLQKKKRNIWWYRGEAKVKGDVVAEGILSAMMGGR